MKKHAIEEQDRVGADIFFRQVNWRVVAIIEDSAFDPTRASGAQRREEVVNNAVELERVSKISVGRLAPSFVTFGSPSMKPVDRSPHHHPVAAGQGRHQLVR
jgi:hypothetical protein